MRTICIEEESRPGFSHLFYWCEGGDSRTLISCAIRADREFRSLWEVYNESRGLSFKVGSEEEARWLAIDYVRMKAKDLLSILWKLNHNMREEDRDYHNMLSDLEHQVHSLLNSVNR